MVICEKDRSILRRLAERYAKIAAEPCHQHTIEGWKRLNDLVHGKPMVWINEIPWHEMDVDGELTLQTEHPFCHEAEEYMRQTIYQWEHMRCDMVVENIFPCHLVIRDSGFGLEEQTEIVMTDPKNDVVSRRYQPQIADEKDLEKICTPQVSCDWQATEIKYEMLQKAFGDILPIELRGKAGFWFAPWDLLVTWWGVEQAMVDLVQRPDLIHAAMRRLMDASLERLNQYVRLNLLASNNSNIRVGSGGYGYTHHLPAPDEIQGQVQAEQIWGCATAQIFAAVSPRMHQEFALQHERRWLERFGLNYYGCCEPLDTKIDILKDLPNLRKISMSPWVNLERAAQRLGDDFVFSYKPNPAVFAEDAWNLEAARRDLVDALEKTRCCVVEIILKDISTVRGQPQRLWEWAAMADEVCGG